MDKFEGSFGSVITTWTDIDELFILLSLVLQVIASRCMDISMMRMSLRPR